METTVKDKEIKEKVRSKSSRRRRKRTPSKGKQSVGLRNLNLKLLNHYLTMTKDEISGDITMLEIEDQGRKCWFQDNGADILMVAQLDVHQPPTFVDTLNQKEHDFKVFCPTIGNRLGVYLAMSYFKDLGLKYDVLLAE